MKNKRRKVEIVIKLPKSLELSGSLVGIMAKSKIYGIDTSIYTPGFYKRRLQDDFRPKIPVATAADWEKHFSSPPHDKKRPWGGVNSWQKGKGAKGIKSFSVKRLLAITDDTITPYMAQQLYHSLDDWAKLLCDWYEVYFQIDTRNTIEVDQHSKDHEGVAVNSQGKFANQLKCRHTITIKLSRGGELQMKPTDWNRILDLTAQQTAPPEAHILLRDSRIELRKKNYRRSVLDAATAAEMALIELRDSTLVNTEPKISSLVKKKYKGIFELVDYLKKTTVTIPEDIVKEVARPRNKAIHQGIMPNKDEAMACLKKSSELVNQSFPIR